MNKINIKNMDCAGLLDALHARGVVLSANDGQLRLFGSDEVLGTAEVIEAIRAQKAPLLKLLETHRCVEPVPLVSDMENRHAPFPLTDIQRAYWVGRQDAFDHGSVAIHYYTEVDVDRLDHERLEQAWNRVVSRHDMLRCVVDADAMQRILPEVPYYRIDRIDLSHLDSKARADALQEHRTTSSHNVHQTNCWPGFELKVLELGNGMSRLCYSQDLLHVDGGSLLLVIEDLCRFYDDPKAELPPMSLQFRDFVFHEIALKDSPGYADDLKYWQEVVADLPPPPALPVTTNRTDGRFQRIGFNLSKTDYAEIRAQSNSMGVTTTGWVMTAFAEIVSRWCGSEDCTLNVTVFNRPSLAPDLLKIVGDFTSMIPVAVHRADGPSLEARGQAMQRRLWDHIGHKDVSGITILNMLRTARQDQAAADLSVVFTSLLNLGGQGFSARGFHAMGEPVFTLTQTPQVTLDHQVSETPDGGIAFTWDYVEGHYPEGMVESMFEAFETLVRRLVAERVLWQAGPVDDLPDGQLQLFDQVNQTAWPYPETETLQSLFLRACEAHADAPAIATAGPVLSYADVRNASLRVAEALQSAGITHGDRVGVMMNKSWAQPVAALAVHLAGAAYVPIDPEIPQARLDHIRDDADLSAILVDPDRAREDASVPMIAVDETCLSTGSPAVVPVQVKPDDISHVIYTSGSTGLPKGVVISHRNVVNRMADIIDRFGIGPKDAALGLTALHHDLSVFDIFGVLAAGATLVLPDEDRRLDPEHWLELSASHQVTLWNSVPAFAGMLADYLDDAPGKATDLGLRWMILAGDWIPVSLPDRLRVHMPDLELIASGGPTETTIWDIWNRVGDVDPKWPSIPYGKPLANAGYHILDQAGRPCPIWVTGELYISGVGVTRGYLNRPDLTAEKYVTLPGVEGPVFKSGDLGRRLPDGTIEFLGRADFQVKIGGMRIELGEIERVASCVPGIADTVAVVQETDTGPSLALFYTKEASGVSPVDLAAQNEAFAKRGVTQTDPAERLATKLQYGALTLPEDAAGIDLGEPAEARQGLMSHRTFCRKMITGDALGTFLAPLRGVRTGATGEVKFAYGSGGGLYPVQIYLYLKPDAVAGMQAGTYQYHPLDHSLRLVRACVLPDDIHWGYNRAFSEAAPIYLYLIADMTVIEAQYGDLAAQMCALEAGAMLQVFRQHAQSSGIGICPVGDISFDRTVDQFDLHDRQKIMVSMVAGPIDPAINGTADDASVETRLEQALVAALPRHMVPHARVNLPELPLTANGKVDRKALSSAEIARRASAVHVDPEGGFETIVSDTLSDLLGRQKVSATDNFFDIGASSALLVKAYQRIKEASGREFPLIALFKHPSVRQLAKAVDAGPVVPDAPDVTDRAQRQSEALKKLRKNRNRV